MGFNPLEKMKQAAYDNTIGKAKDAAENAKMNLQMKVEEKKDQAIQAAKDKAVEVKDSAIENAKKIANGENPFEVKQEKLLDADDYLELAKKSNIAIWLYDNYMADYYEEDEADEDHPDYECCKQCGSWFGDTESLLVADVKSYKKDEPLVKNKEIKGINFCCKECAEQYYATKIPGVFITLDVEEQKAFLAAGRKLTGTETKFDKMNSKLTKSYNTGIDKENAKKEAEKAKRTASPFASLFKMFKK